jgi:CRISPR/Cas system-associated exonuclease Cas4 (RecB family)
MIATLLLIAAVLALTAAWRLGRSTGVSVASEILTTDVGRESAPLLQDAGLGLRGRPDYVLREAGTGKVYPVEVKPTRNARDLYASDRLQIGVYMLLTAKTYGGEFAGYGVVRYRSRAFRVPLTSDLSSECRAVADEVRSARRARNVHRSHASVARCRGCSLRHDCVEALGTSSDPRIFHT